MTDRADSVWQGIVDLHARPGVEEICLQLQDAHGQCVSFLLWAAWAAQAGRWPAGAELARAAAAARAWEVEVSAPLRAVRRRLKRPLGGVQDVPRLAFRQAVLAQELGGERLLAEALEALTPAIGSEAREVATALAAASRAYGDGGPAAAALLASLADAC